MAKPKSFEDAVNEVEKLVKMIESEAIGLEESLLAYDRGTTLLKHCREILDKAEQKIEKLSRDADGRPKVGPI